MTQRGPRMIGIMSDSHDNLTAVKQAVALFHELDCELVIHAGDFVAPFAARELERLSCPVKAVFGNCDGEKKGLKKILQSFGEIQKEPFPFMHRGLKFLVTHCHFANDSYVASGRYDILIFGHTHKPEVKTEKGTLLINPGETGGWVSGESTIAVLDTKILAAEIMAL